MDHEAFPEALRQRYRPERTLGSGAMGVVFLARALATGRPVAVKVLARSGSTDALARFLREGRLMLSVQHPHVVAVSEVHELAGQACLVCEYVEGGSLRARLDGAGALAPEAAVGLMHDALAGLAACHARGIVHRDVKPANVLIDAHGRAKLTDFGIAKEVVGDAAPLTRDGSIIGTPAYMSPEQARGDPAQPASDVYAAGVVLYEMLAGVPPFRAATLSGVLRAHLEVLPPPLAERAPGVPQALAAAVHRALAKDPAGRPAGAQAMADELVAALRPPGASRPRPVRGTDAPSQGARAMPAPLPSRVMPAPLPSRVLGAFTLIGIALLGAVRVLAPPSPVRDASAVPAPVAPAVVPGEVREVRAQADAVESEPARVAPWNAARPARAGAEGAELECPLVLSCLDHLVRLRIRPLPGCTVAALNGVPMPELRARGETLTVVSPQAGKLVEGLNWLRVRGAPGREVGAVVYQERGPCRFQLRAHALPPPEVAAYNRVARVLFRQMPAQTRPARAVVEAEPLDRADPFRAEALARIELSEDDLVDSVIGAVAQRTDDPMWVDAQKLDGTIRASVETIQRALAHDPRRWDAWHDLGLTLRKARHPAAARTALVRALMLWPGAYLSWRDLGYVHRRAWREARMEDDRQKAMRAFRLARRFHAASGLDIFWMQPELEGFLTELGARR